VGYLAGTRAGGGKIPLVLFLAGMVVSLTAAGMVAGVVGRSLSLTVPVVRWAAGIAFVVAGLAYLGAFGGSKTCKVPLPPGSEKQESRSPLIGRREGRLSKESVRAGPAGAFAMGALYGLSASPCATPALVAILVLVATTRSLARGALLLLMYSIGQSVPAVVAGLATSRFNVFFERERNIKVLEYLRKAGGGLVLAAGLYLLLRPYLGLP